MKKVFCGFIITMMVCINFYVPARAERISAVEGYHGLFVGSGDNGTPEGGLALNEAMLNLTIAGFMNSGGDGYIPKNMLEYELIVCLEHCKTGLGGYTKEIDAAALAKIPYVAPTASVVNTVPPTIDSNDTQAQILKCVQDYQAYMAVGDTQKALEEIIKCQKLMGIIQ